MEMVQRKKSEDSDFIWCVHITDPVTLLTCPSYLLQVSAVVTLLLLRPHPRGAVSTFSLSLLPSLSFPTCGRYDGPSDLDSGVLKHLFQIILRS
jgi:hypothetical protein